MTQSPHNNQMGRPFVADEGVSFEMVGNLFTSEREKREIAQFEADLKRKKKKKKRPRSQPQDTSSCEGGNCDYSYTALLDRIFSGDTNSLTAPSHRLPRPQIALHGAKRTGWGNFKAICNGMDRPADHVQSFFLAEMSTTGNLDGSGSFILRGRWKPQQIESVLKKYIREYVSCDHCRSPKTAMRRDRAARLFFLDCGVCGASRSVKAIRAGFHATTRDDRRAAKNATK